MTINQVVHKLLRRKSQVAWAFKPQTEYIVLLTSTSSNWSFSQVRSIQHSRFNLSRLQWALLPSGGGAPIDVTETRGPSGGKVVFIAKRGGGKTRSGLKWHRIVPGGKWRLTGAGIAIGNEIFWVCFYTSSPWCIFLSLYTSQSCHPDLVFDLIRASRPCLSLTTLFLLLIPDLESRCKIRML